MILFARKLLRALIVFIFAHVMQIQVAHALCKQGCRLISYTANIRLVTIAACYNCPRSPLLRFNDYCSSDFGSSQSLMLYLITAACDNSSTAFHMCINRPLSLQADDIFQNVRSQLASLAVFIEQARLDERRHVSDQRISFHDDLLRLEEEGLYNILCGLQVRINWHYVYSHCHVTQQIAFNVC